MSSSSQAIEKGYRMEIDGEGAGDDQRQDQAIPGLDPGNLEAIRHDLLDQFQAFDETKKTLFWFCYLHIHTDGGLGH